MRLGQIHPDLPGFRVRVFMLSLGRLKLGWVIYFLLAFDLDLWLKAMWALVFSISTATLILVPIFVKTRPGAT